MYRGSSIKSNLRGNLYGGYPQIRGTLFWGVHIIRTIVFGVYVGVPLLRETTIYTSINLIFFTYYSNSRKSCKSRSPIGVSPLHLQGCRLRIIGYFVGSAVHVSWFRVSGLWGLGFGFQAPGVQGICAPIEESTVLIPQIRRSIAHRCRRPRQRSTSSTVRARSSSSSSSSRRYGWARAGGNCNAPHGNLLFSNLS